MKKMNNKGFTIVELVIVIAVIAILAGVLIPTFSGIVSKANASAALQEATSAMKATLAMSDYGTLTDGTQFVIVKDSEISYKFAYNNNAIAAIDSTTANPAEMNTIIIHGTTVDNVTTVKAADVKMIAAACGLEMDITKDATKPSGKDYFEISTYAQATGKAVADVKYYSLSNGAFTEVTTGITATETDVSTYYTKNAESLRVFVNTDYPKEIVTLTKSN